MLKIVFDPLSMQADAAATSEAPAEIEFSPLETLANMASASEVSAAMDLVHLQTLANVAGTSEAQPPPVLGGTSPRPVRAPSASGRRRRQLLADPGSLVVARRRRQPARRQQPFVHPRSLVVGRRPAVAVRPPVPLFSEGSTGERQPLWPHPNPSALAIELGRLAHDHGVLGGPPRR